MDTRNVTVRLTEEDRRLVAFAAEANGVSAAAFMAGSIRQSARAAQIARYNGPDADTQAWQDDADAAAEAMMAFTAAEAGE